jgi:hypothetical protein
MGYTNIILKEKKEKLLEWVEQNKIKIMAEWEYVVNYKNLKEIIEVLF